MMCGIPVLKLQELSLFWWISSMVLPVSSPWRSISSVISQWNDVNHPTIPQKISFGSYVKSTNGKVRTKNMIKFPKNNFYTSWILRGGVSFKAPPVVSRSAREWFWSYSVVSMTCMKMPTAGEACRNPWSEHSNGKIRSSQHIKNIESRKQPSKSWIPLKNCPLIECQRDKLAKLGFFSDTSPGPSTWTLCVTWKCQRRSKQVSLRWESHHLRSVILFQISSMPWMGAWFFWRYGS